MNLIEQAEDITSMQIPGIIAETCKSWDTYSSQDVVLELDSGL